MRDFILLSTTVSILFLAAAFATERPDVPDNLKAPPTEEVILKGHATGVQIYTCQASGGQNAAWVLKAPEAELTDTDGKTIVHHFAGPTWKHIDGSEVTGKLAAKHDAPKPDAIAWLLLSAATHKGEGILSHVTTIQRIHTEGGLPPKASECNESANGKESRSSYSADYYFYAAR